MKIWSLQILRFVAALGVVVFHAGWFAEKAYGQRGIVLAVGEAVGRAGVDVFFVLSGSIIATVSRGMRPGNFAVHRLRRIYPIYLLLALPWIAFAAVVGSLDWRSLLATITLWPVTNRITEPVSPVAWTLCFEVLFYICAALVLWRRWVLPVLLVTYATALIAPVSALPQFVGSPLCLEFLAGVVIAQLPRRKWMALGLPAGALLLIALSFDPTGARDAQMVATGFHDVWVRVAMMGVPAALIVWGTLQLKAKPGVLTYLGDASYSLYLSHSLVLMLLSAILAKLLPGAPVDAVALVGIAAAIVVGWRIHELFEKPLLRAMRPKSSTTVLAAT